MEKELFFQLFSKALLFGKEILNAKKRTSESLKHKTSFIASALAHLCISLMIGNFCYENFTEMSFTHLTELSAIFLAVTQSMSSLAILYAHLPNWTTLVDRLIEERRSVRKVPGKIDDEWEVTLNYCKKEFMAATICVVLSGLCCFFAMTNNFLFDSNDFHLPMNFYVVNLSSDLFGIKWLFNYACQLTLAIPLSVTVTIFFPFSLVLMNHSCLLLDVVIIFVGRLNRLLPGNDACENLTRNEIAKEMKTIIDKTQRILVWLEGVQDLLKLYFMVSFANLSVQLCLCIYTLSSNPFGSIIILMGLLVFLSQLFVFCWMGSRIASRIDALAASLYNVDWHLMEVKQQKHLKLILMMTQTMKSFDGVFNPVNMETFKEVLNFSYSLFMLLRSKELN